MNYLSSNIKYLRLSKNLTQEQLSKIVDKSRVLISQWESDSREITTEDIIKLSDYFKYLAPCGCPQRGCTAVSCG